VAESAGLNGVHVLVTRPAPQAGPLAQRIREAGGVARLFPVVEIVDPEDILPLSRIVDRLDSIDLAIFISPNAVNRAMHHILARRSLPTGLRLACVGRGSARELKRLGYTDVIAPLDRSDSEALLALPALQPVAGEKIVIFRGDGGRAILGDALTGRGASVEYVECYRRIRPVADASSLIDDWRRGEVDIVSVTSTQGLKNLYALLGESGRSCLLSTPIVVLSERTARTCRELGFTTEPLVTTDASDAAIVETIQTWQARQNSL
jgi:uroporphyrinogen-III synthase